LQSLVASEQRSRGTTEKELREAVARREVLWGRMKVVLWVAGALFLAVMALILWR